MRVVGRLGERVARAVALAAAVAMLACGGGHPSPPPTDGSGAPAPDGGGGSPPAGGSGSPGASGGSTPANTGGDAGSPAPAAGSPGAGGGGGSAAPPSTGGGGPGSTCAGLAPTFGAAVELSFDTGTHRDCSVATTSVSGQVALGVTGSWGGFAGTMFGLYSPDGSVDAASVDGILFNYQPGGSPDLDAWFHPTSSGYAGIVHPGNANPLPFRTWDASGRLVAEIERFAVSTAPDRSGGSLVLARAFDPANPEAPPGPTKLEWVDAAGRLARAVTLDRDPVHVISSWATGHVVVVVPGSPGSARWFDERGSPLTPWFDVGEVSSGPSLHLLLDGRIAIRSGDQWRIALSDGVASAGAVPVWLASRPSTRLATIRGGRAYAVLPMVASPSGGTSFEIVTGSGESCGSFSTPPVVNAQGVTKTPLWLDVGQDGTLLQRSGVALDPNPSGIHCAFRWWPALLR